MGEEEARWERLIHGLRHGDNAVVREFCARYGDMLRRLADRHMTPGLQRRVDPDDVVQSVCRTFLRRVQLGQFTLSDSESLWQLLCAITLTKVRMQARHHTSQKRSLSREEAVGDDAAVPEPPAPGPAPDEAAEFADAYQKVLASLDAEERQVVELKLQDCTNEEVAQRLGSSERTVRRIVKRIQAAFVRTFEAS